MELHLNIVNEIGEKICERVTRMLVIEIEIREYPDRDLFRILRFLILIFFAA